MKASGYLEVSALFEAHWTGIPMVVAAIAKRALADPSVIWHFIHENVLLPRKMIEDALTQRNGTAARRILVDGAWENPQIDYSVAAEGSVVFTNIKPFRGQFRREAMIVYDLSPLLTPQFHNADNVSHFSNRFGADVDTSCHFFPISRSTQQDLELYFAVPSAACTMIRLGVDMDLASVSYAQHLMRESETEPYVVVLGTLEPRKNGRIVLEYLARNPGFARRFKVVFIGRDGWLEERERLIGLAVAAGVPRDRIMFTGYVSEREKIGLLYHAAFCIYASFFEGFGLPILEAAVLGKIVVCSNTSSMPEVAPDNCFFFSPGSIFEFSRALSRAEKRCLQTRPALGLGEVSANLAANGWQPCYETIRNWIDE